MKQTTKPKSENRETQVKGLILKLLQAAHLVLEGHPNKEKLFINFMRGLAIVEYKNRTGNTSYSNRVESLTKPVFDIMLNYLKSDEYRKAVLKEEVAGDELFEIDFGTSSKAKIRIPITTKKVLDHIKKTDVLVLVPQDVRPVLHEMLNNYEERYGSQRKAEKPQKVTTFQELFKEPDSISTAQKVKDIVTSMNLCFSSDNKKPIYTNKIGDEIHANKNSLAYIFAALRDSENGIEVIDYNAKHKGGVGHQLFVFYSEFGLIVSELKKSGDVTRKNVMSVLKNEQRFEKDIYKDFTSFFRK